MQPDPQTLKRFFGYIEERERIRLARFAGEPWPWTDDPILRKYKFTNVRRKHDRTTQGLLQIYQEHQSAAPHVILYNCGVYRYFGTLEYALAVGWQRTHDPRRLTRVARDRMKRGERVFTGAYMVTNAGRAGSKEGVVAGFLGGLWKEAKNIFNDMWLSGVSGQPDMSWQLGYNALVKLDGFGGSGFMAKEVLQDFILATEREGEYFWVDSKNWTPVGPGARRGLNRIFKRPVKFVQSETAWVNECLDIYARRPKNWLLDAVEPLTAHDIQFCLCEFDKMERVRLGQGKPRSLYRYEELR